MRQSKLVRLLALSSQFLNVLVFDGSNSETVSARSYRKGIIEGDKGWAKASKWIDKLFFFTKDHTKKAYELDLESAKALLSKLGYLFDEDSR